MTLTNEYYPNGDPDKWTFSLTPFLWMPRTSGEFESEYLSAGFEAKPVDFLDELKMFFMIDGEASKGRFFISPSYVYVKLGAEEVVDVFGTETWTIYPEMKMNIAELMTGMHFPLNSKWILDPYLGVRYNNFHAEMEVDKGSDTDFVDETSVFWDPVVGFRVLYFPHPRVPIILKADVGGFTVGSRISSTGSLTAGYTVSPLIDLLMGFTYYYGDFENDSIAGEMHSMNIIMYGFTLGVKFVLPTRYRDPSLYKEKKEKKEKGDEQPE